MYYKKTLKQWWSTIPPIWTKRTISFCLDWIHWTQKHVHQWWSRNPPISTNWKPRLILAHWAQK